MSEKRSFKAICAVLCAVITYLSMNISFSAIAASQKPFEDDVTVSILGDSISTFNNYSNNLAADTTNSTIRNYPVHYYTDRYGMTVNDTWWMKTINEMGGRLLVNNAYSGSKIFYPNSSSTSLGYLSRATNLHDNTGKNSGEKPDIIAVYLGTNDFTHCSDSLGTASKINYNKLIKKTSTGYSYATPVTSSEAYAIMLHKIKQKYPAAEIYCFTILPRLELSSDSKKALRSFNNSITSIAKCFGCYTVDIYSDTGINFNEENIKRYIGDSYLHPGKQGMEAISNAFLSALYKNSKYLSKNETVYNVNYTLDEQIIVKQGTKKAVLGSQPFRCSFSKLEYGSTDVKVTMGGVDITSECYKNCEINIPVVTGNIEITARYSQTERSFDNYRWEVFDKGDDNTEPETTLPESNTEESFSDITTTEALETEALTHETESLLTENIEPSLPLNIEESTTEAECTEPVTEAPITESVTEPEITIPETEPESVPSTEDTSLPAEPETTQATQEETENITPVLSENFINIVSNENTENKINIITGVVENSVFHQTEFVLDKNIELFYDKPWILAWRSHCLGGSFTPIVFSSVENTTNEDAQLIHIIDNTSILAFSHYSEGILYSVGIDLAEYNISLSDEHTYKLVNVPGKTGTPTVHLYIDGSKIGELNKVYLNGEYKGADTSFFSEKDFSFKYIGTVDKPLNNCILKYVQVWENSIPQNHIHNISYQTTTKVSCTADGSINHLCDCGYNEKEILQPALGHKALDWQITTTATVDRSGVMKRICSRCKKTVETKTIAQKKCAAPKLVSAQNCEAGVKITWKSSSGADAYKVYRKLKDGSWVCVTTISSTSYTDKSASSGKIYNYTVRATNEAGCSSFYSPGLQIKYIGTPKATVQNTADGVKIGWKKVSGAKYYKIYRKKGSGSWELIKKTSSLSYTDKKASNGKTYSYTIKASDDKYLSSYNHTGFTIKRLAEPPIKSVVSSKTGITFKWGKVTGASGYYVYRKEGKGDWKKIATTKTTAYLDKSAKKGKTYTYTVKAYSGTSSSSYKKSGVSIKDKY